jgi:hypothetical protein
MAAAILFAIALFQPYVLGEAAASRYVGRGDCPGLCNKTAECPANCEATAGSYYHVSCVQVEVAGAVCTVNQGQNACGASQACAEFKVATGTPCMKWMPLCNDPG